MTTRRASGALCRRLSRGFLCLNCGDNICNSTPRRDRRFISESPPCSPLFTSAQPRPPLPPIHAMLALGIFMRRFFVVFLDDARDMTTLHAMPPDYSIGSTPPRLHAQALLPADDGTALKFRGRCCRLLSPFFFAVELIGQSFAGKRYACRATPKRRQVSSTDFQASGSREIYYDGFVVSSAPITLHAARISSKVDSLLLIIIGRRIFANAGFIPQSPGRRCLLAYYTRLSLETRRRCGCRCLQMRGFDAATRVARQATSPYGTANTASRYSRCRHAARRNEANTGSPRISRFGGCDRRWAGRF